MQERFGFLKKKKQPSCRCFHRRILESEFLAVGAGVVGLSLSEVLVDEGREIGLVGETFFERLGLEPDEVMLGKADVDVLAFLQECFGVFLVARFLLRGVWDAFQFPAFEISQQLVFGWIKFEIFHSACFRV